MDTIHRAVERERAIGNANAHIMAANQFRLIGHNDEAVFELEMARQTLAAVGIEAENLR